MSSFASDNCMCMLICSLLNADRRLLFFLLRFFNFNKDRVKACWDQDRKEKEGEIKKTERTEEVSDGRKKANFIKFSLVPRT